MKKILTILIVLCFTSYLFADQVTTNYNLIIPEEGSFDWTAKISNDLISIDAIMFQISSDVGGTNAWTRVGTVVKTATGGDTVSIDAAGILTVSGDTFLANVGYPTDTPADNEIIKYDAALGRLNFEAATSSPAGADTQVQYNDGGSLAGDAQLTWNKTTDVLTTPIISIISSDISILSDTVIIISNDIATYGGPLSIVSSDLSNISGTVVIISNDAVDWEQMHDIVSSDISNISDTIVIISNDAVDWVQSHDIISSDIGLISGTVVIISNDMTGLATQQKDIQLIEPDQIVTVSKDSVMFTVDAINYPNGIKVRQLRLATSESTTTTYAFEEWDSPVWSTATVSSIDIIGVAGASEATETTITDSDVAAGAYVIFAADSTDIDWAHGTIWFNAKN